MQVGRRNRKRYKTSDTEEDWKDYKTALRVKRDKNTKSKELELRS